MKEDRNPFSPGAGTPPPELAGREEVIQKASIVTDRALHGRAFQSLMLVGLRGVGKTVLLNQIGLEAEEKRYQVVHIEAPEGRRIAELLSPALRRLVLKLNMGAAIAEKSRTALSALRNFVGKFKISVGDFEVTLSPEPGLADTGDIETDLTSLMVAIGEALKEKQTVGVLLIDEMQYLHEDDFSALIMALHRVAQKKLPVVLIGAGLPQLVGLAGRAKSYAERLFEYPPIGPLSPTDAAQAIRVPLQSAACDIDEAAMGQLYDVTQGYPYFLQAWAYAMWNAANDCPITGDTIAAIQGPVLKRLDESFFRVRFDRLTPREKEYVRTMASLGPGPLRSSEIAAKLGREMSALAPLRSSLIKKGMIYSPAHGDTAFTVPLFDQFILRMMPTEP